MKLRLSPLLSLTTLATLGLGCSSADPSLISRAEAAPRYKAVRIDGIPHVRQKPDFCGEACAEMALRKLGHPVTQDQVFNVTGVDPALGRGAITRELARGLKRLGFTVGAVWYRVQAKRPAPGLEHQFRKLHADLLAGVPSIVCTHFDEQPRTTEHFRLIVGYDPNRDEVLYHDPALDKGGYLRMKRAKLLRLWPLKYRKDRWTVIRMPLRVKAIKPPGSGKPAGARFSAAAFAQHVRQLRRRVGKGYTIVVQPPFVVIGDEAPAKVRRRAVMTVKWSVGRLKRNFFAQDPTHILDVWLLRNKASYEAHCKRLFGGLPGTPYGFYSARYKALVMNIATGGGTLVHEIVHPLMEANFPHHPPWFNEGLGSLFEQCAACGDDGICGLTNWRLAGLQQAIKARRVPSFRTLTSRSSHQFYQQDRGTNYAQARYLLYYLQQRGLLKTYYRRFLRDQRADPTGYRTLQSLLKVKDMTAWQRQWEAYVLGLKFP